MVYYHLVFLDGNFIDSKARKSADSMKLAPLRFFLTCVVSSLISLEAQL